MPLDHYLPATFLACFSVDSSNTRRNRRIWAVDKRSGRLFSTSASNLCGVNDLYTVDYRDPRIIDKMWSGYEGRLANAIEDLIAARIDALTWANTLVPFVSALLVRGREFAGRFEGRFVAKLGASILPIFSKNPDNANWARLIEWQRLQSSVLGAKWTVLETTGPGECITNDLGFNGMEANKVSKGIAVSVGPRHVVTIIPTLEKHVVAVAKSGTWRPAVGFEHLDDEQREAMNRCFATSAQRFVIGSNERTISHYIVQQDVPPGVPEPTALGFMSGMMAMHYEHTYVRLLNDLASPPAEDGSFIYVDYRRNIKAANLIG